MQPVKSILLLLAGLACCLSVSCASDYSPIFTGIKATFEETLSALKELWAEIRNVRVQLGQEYEGMTADELEETRRKMGALVEVCQFDKAKCGTVFHQIEVLRTDIDEQLVNLFNYLDVCFKQQKEFCARN